MEMESFIRWMWNELKPTCKKLFNNNYIKFRAVMMRVLKDIDLNDADLDYFDIEEIDCLDISTFINSLLKSLRPRSNYDENHFIEEEILRNIEYLENEDNTNMTNIDIINKVDTIINTIMRLSELKGIELSNLRMRLF